MALCSQVFNTSNKRRSCDNYLPQQKKVCLKNVGCNKKLTYLCPSSSEEDNDSEDEQSCYNADQIRAKRRASMRVSFLSNPVLSRAVSQYSDDDEESHNEEETANAEESVERRRFRRNVSSGTDDDSYYMSSSKRLTHRPSTSISSISHDSAATASSSNVQSIAAAAAAAAATYENLDCKLSTSPISSVPFTFNYFENNNCVFNFSENNAHHDDNSTAGSATSALNIVGSSAGGNQYPHHSITPTSSINSAPISMKNSAIATDKTARSRCFEYLVGSIDEAWARYCDAATNVEDEVYGYNTPASVATDDEYFFDNTTDITDYEDSDFDEKRQQTQQPKQFMRPRLSSSASSTSLASTKEDPSSCQLQALKDRLTKAKYYLQDLVDSDNIHDVNSFWKRWDMIKYATIELVEDDDDDEVVETTIDELESGRYFGH